ncbi:hypothetical protein Pmar_PMAR013019 [Perkinsus marinus ATCC 50983]|uniref:Uncharacterized protein n=1 Tax=Perkinsus marinus (strain ATCC 50983 / TXsc) TaxID=423536 RepID=C5LPV3_PERM5|nr:hypothetical protein Pmar_PMAR013019 [Perkinsus marinus ATCC 50983]EER01240.1 hypothetical protein Pmar_PMAR013019 [Perkinsus marinus ATCC 50983]|eukprot:XP_002768522.1 hypothetical protein Pmar_PMAR013019 [Perkinsus marinus ATCC 50983]
MTGAGFEPETSSTEVLEGERMDGNHKICALRLQVVTYNPFSASTMETFWLCVEDSPTRMRGLTGSAGSISSDHVKAPAVGVPLRSSAS